MAAGSAVVADPRMPSFQNELHLLHLICIGFCAHKTGIVRTLSPQRQTYSHVAGIQVTRHHSMKFFAAISPTIDPLQPSVQGPAKLPMMQTRHRPSNLLLVRYRPGCKLLPREQRLR